MKTNARVCVTESLLYSRGWHNIVKQLYYNLFLKFLIKKKRRGERGRRSRLWFGLSSTRSEEPPGGGGTGMKQGPEGASALPGAQLSPGAGHPGPGQDAAVGGGATGGVAGARPSPCRRWHRYSCQDKRRLWVVGGRRPHSAAKSDEPGGVWRWLWLGEGPPHLCRHGSGHQVCLPPPLPCGTDG